MRARPPNRAGACAGASLGPAAVGRTELAELAMLRSAAAV